MWLSWVEDPFLENIFKYFQLVVQNVREKNILKKSIHWPFKNIPKMSMVGP